jgi:dissimilatory sulfite reductase (desulfoviridin) alpha/beta subunit
MIDGSRSVLDIIDEMKEKFEAKIEPATERIGTFMQKLHQNKFIHFIELLENKNV